MTAAALHAQGLVVRLGERPVLHDVHLSLPRGRWTAVVGPNGAGKSTLLRALAGMDAPAQVLHGEVRLLGRPLRQWPARERACSLAWLGQNQPVSGDMRVQDVVMLGRLPHQGWLAAPGPADHAAVEQALRQTQGWEWRERSVGSLSGGERQRVLLARALAVQAQVLLMDEPLANLDPPHQADWLECVQSLIAEGRTVVSVLHEISMALQAQELVILDRGRVAHQGGCADPATHAVLETVFEHRLRIHAIDGQWLALPRLRGKAGGR
ncbi:Probable siderophore transport system ATP-binding protein YusV [Delftia tsuruhatensis]|uniref:ABC transporter ATP-binding protein n=1 Tax=Delftia tsuruhatensis TaxID=180282 RepID=UPI001E80BA3F|nr:ABC transporter ATP-binding protein [Delftia tsuruhatensis]CAB5693306.1 Probable siderophore transport system ATP-binding protein YusV [Delftia tsuruhatensis]CAC9687496.1 Probable siderophore transport system ATP-binding protein YusV [Delftia tsuruhatensis]